jgi:hypothetical protein
MRRIVKGLLLAAAAAVVAAPAAIAAADPTPDPTPKIVGGTDATETYSFMASLKSSDGWGCGASLIRATWIVTARHCVTGDDDEPSAPGTLTFRIGTLRQDSGGSVARARRVIRYTGADVALVELTAPVAQRPVDIATAAPVGTATRIIGWGCTKDPGCSGADMLQQLDTSILADNTCGGGQHYLCIENPDGWRGACYGDSGGPAVVRAGSSWRLVGATSGGTSAICGQAPSVYGDLTFLRPWIESHAGPGGGDGGGGTGDNLALDRPARSAQESCTPDESPAKAVNGSVTGGFSDKWCSGDGATKRLRVDLGAARKLTRLTVRHAGAGGEAADLNTRDFVLETSRGGSVWRTVATITGNTAAVTDTPVDVTARYIRISTTDPVARIYEFEAYG